MSALLFLKLWLFYAYSMTAFFIWAQMKKQMEWVDVAWVINFSLILFFILGNIAKPNQVQTAIAGMIIFWSIRLGLFLYTTRIRPKHADGRYAALAQRYGKHKNIKFFLFFQAQAVVNAFFSFTFLVPLIYGQGNLTVFQILIVGIWFIAWIGETLSDLQLYLFKQNPNNKGKVCNVGLWRYSRHPNYFFEWLNWWALALFSLGLPFFYLTFIAPLLISFFLFKVTGIPMTEAQSLKSKGAAYAQYQKETSVFVPWFVKKA